MNNKQAIELILSARGYGEVIGCWDVEMNKVTYRTMQRIAEIIGTDYSLKYTVKGKTYIFETATVGKEVDFMVMSLEEYRTTYGNDKY